MSIFKDLNATRLRQIAQKLYFLHDSEATVMARECEDAATLLDKVDAGMEIPRTPRTEMAKTEERKRISGRLRTVAINLIKDEESDGIDGYTGAVVLNLASVIDRNGEINDAAARFEE